MNAAAYVSLAEIFAAEQIDHGAKDSTQCKCLTKYLSELGSQSFFIERDYVDAGYLADYAGYYALCHETPKKLTTRLHFFSLPHDQVNTLWRRGLQSQADIEEVQAELNAAYLGFIVLKPLPATVIGKTCLRTYPAHDDQTGRDRTFPIKRHYIVGLWGLTLTVDSVAFQEQDREIAACATAAIWSAMHAMPSWFTVHEIPSPFQITSSGWDGKIMPMEGETASRFPSNGMDVKQIVGCLRQHGIETSVLGLPTDDGCTKLLENIAAYLDAGTPILLVGTLYGKRIGEPHFTRRGLHAATVLGYGHRDTFKEDGWSGRIERIYIHDDTLGPFASYAIERCDAGTFPAVLQYGADQEVQPVERVVTTYLKNNSAQEAGIGVSSYVVPRYIVVPINPKQHLPYPTVRDFAGQLYAWHKRVGPMYYGGPFPPISWSIRLVDQVAFKTRILKNSAWLDIQQKESILNESLPRLLWTIDFTALVDDAEKMIAMLVLDATSLQQEGAVRNILVGDADRAETLFSLWLSCFEHYEARKDQTINGVPRMDSNLEACAMRLRKVLKVLMQPPAA